MIKLATKVGIVCRFLYSQEMGEIVMECANCKAVVSRFDVHCRSCGAVLEAPTVEQQLATLGIDVEHIERESAEEGTEIAKAAYKSRVRARNLQIGREVADAVGRATFEFFRQVFRP